MHGLRRMAVRLAGSTSPYASIANRPRCLTTSTLSVTRSSRLTSHLHARRAFVSTAENAGPDSAQENSDPLAKGAAGEAAEGAAPAPAAESSVTEDVTEATSREPLQPETTSAEPLNLDEIQPVAAERDPPVPTATEADRAVASGEEPLESQVTPEANASAAQPAAGSEAVDAASATIAEPAQQPETFKEAPSSTAESVVAETGAGAAGKASQLIHQGGDRCLYIGNLFFEVTDSDLRRHFEPYGEIVGVNVVTDMRGISRGYGFIEYKRTEDAQRARLAEDTQAFRGRRLTVRISMTLQEREREREAGRGPRSWHARGPRGATAPSTTLFIGNLSYEMTDRGLNELFGDVRNVLDVRVAIDRQSGQPRGFAHADFTDIESATRAKEILEAKTPMGRRVKVDYSESRGRAT